jgi:hypothetical protein
MMNVQIWPKAADAAPQLNVRFWVRVQADIQQSSLIVLGL